MKPRKEYKVEKLIAGGLGLARDESGVILLPETLPDEIVLAEPTGVFSGARRGQVAEVLRPSPLRITPDCPSANLCGGCDFLHVAPGQALALKSRAALERLAEQSGLAIELVQSPLQQGYRSRAVVHVGQKNEGRGVVGFFSADRQVVEFENCRLLDPALMDLLPPLRSWADRHFKLLPSERADYLEAWLIKEVNWLSNSVPAETLKPALNCGGALPLRGAVNDDSLAICFSPPPAKAARAKGPRRNSALSSALLEALKDLRRDLDEHGLVVRGLSSPFPAETSKPPLNCGGALPLRGKETSIYARRAPGQAARRIDHGPAVRLASADWPQWGLTLFSEPGGFTQVNPQVNKLMVELVLAEAAAIKSMQPKALDLYAGLGNISLPLVKSGFEVTAVEQSPEGARAARENGRGLPGFTVINERCEKAVDDLARQNRRFNLLVLDPPRSGAGALLAKLSALAAEKIIYIACHPAVLERDLPTLASMGYRAVRLIALDMFPRTSHLETMAVLELR